MNNPISIKFRRHPEGCMINVTVSPDVEEFFKYWGGGEEIYANEFGTRWRAAGKTTEPIKVWSMFSNNKGLFDLNLMKSGDVLDFGGNVPKNITHKYRANLAILRLVGASNPEGTTFIYHDLYDEDSINQLLNEFMKASEVFYKNYIRPFKLSIELKEREADNRP